MKNRRIRRNSNTLTRRELLRFLGATGAFTLVGCLRAPSDATESTAASTDLSTQTFTPSSTQTAAEGAIAQSPNCVVRPQQTEGPFFVDERLNRSDIRSDPATGFVSTGVPLLLAFQVTQIGGGRCVPLNGALVDVWHCDAAGVYSDVGSAQGKRFLRGSQVTDANGLAQFVTIYPGWYPGRTVHIHFKIRTDPAAQSGYEFTSQLYFDDALTDQIFAQAPYAERGQRSVRNDEDGIFQNGGAQLIVPVTRETSCAPASGSENCYTAKFGIGLQV